MYWHYPHYHPLGGRPASAIREGDYKLIEFLDNGDLELYNIRNDIGETTNLASTNKGLALKMLKKLRSWQKSINAKMPTENKSFKKN